MKPVSYFSTPIAGVMHRRYHLGHTDAHGIFHVTARQLSRPDGIEIAEPARVVMVEERPRVTFKPEKKREYNPPVDNTKRCPRCDQRLVREAFSPKMTGRLQSWCKSCTNSYRRVRKEAA